MNYKQTLRPLASLLVVLLLMPLGHALMILMEHYMSPTALHYGAFMMGLAGLAVMIAGIFKKGDTRQTIYGITGAMLFWTGWVEFLFVYYAQRYGVHCDLVGNGIVQTTTHYMDGIGVSHDYIINGQPLDSLTRQELKEIRGSRPEYLIMPATFGMWVMVMVLYIFRTRTGCDFIRWIQRKLKIDKLKIENSSASYNLTPYNLFRFTQASKARSHPYSFQPYSFQPYSPSLTVFMEWNVMMWGSYLLLMFCYDPVFLGSSHPVTIAIALLALVASLLMLRRMFRIKTWGRSIRYALATVIVFWTFVEVMGRNKFLNEVWTDPLGHTAEMLTTLAIFAGVIVAALIFNKKTSR